MEVSVLGEMYVSALQLSWPVLAGLVREISGVGLCEFILPLSFPWELYAVF